MHLASSACWCLGIISFWTLQASAQSTTLVSISNSGIQGDEESYYPVLSADGRFTAFYSDASNLVGGDNNSTGDVFLHDRRSGRTIRVSVDSTGVEGDGESTYPAISAAGLVVAYSSSASNLVPGDTNGSDDVFVFDVRSRRTTRVSVDSNGVEGNGRCSTPSLSANGRYVAFWSAASNLVANDLNGRPDIFVHDRWTGTTTRVSVSSTGAESNGDSSFGPSISADGTRIAFDCKATNLVNGANGSGDVYVRDVISGTTTCASLDLSGLPGNGGTPSISGNGRVVVFVSGDANLVVGDSNGLTDAFVRDLVTGTTTRVSVDSNGVEANGLSSYLAISFDGSQVVFGSYASNLVTGDTNGEKDIFLRDRTSNTTTRMSVDSNLAQANGRSSTPAISANGRDVAFYSQANNLVAGDTNGETDVFVHRRW